ncbi:MAG TPA: YciI family protein [Bacteroidia bacterium]|nr:YciI family protein [Bacteroidia bacterium]
MKYAILLALLNIFTTSLFSQNPNPLYDSVMAKRLQADERGMKMYCLVILKTGPVKMPKGPGLDSLFNGHFANMKSLADQKLLVLAGPFEKNQDQFRGLFILNVSSKEEALKLCESDPTVRAGILSPEIYPWYGSAALQELNALHRSIQKN